MSLLHTPIFNTNHFKPGHLRSRSYNELLSQFKSAISSTSKNSSPSPSVSRSTYVKKRSYSDLIRESPGLTGVDEDSKRARTAPPSPPYDSYASRKASISKLPSTLNFKSGVVVRSRSLSPVKRAIGPISPTYSPNTSPVTPKMTLEKSLVADTVLPSVDSATISSSSYSTSSSSTSKKSGVTLPSISAALQSAPLTPVSNVKLNPITPTVSLDYFDTYKPNDENWRYELLDSITKTSKNFNLNRYNYLNRSPSTQAHTSTYSSNPNHHLHSSSKPAFNSKISSKILHNSKIEKQPRSYSSRSPKAYTEKKINFPYESNYTYLNKTYLTDVEKYPEYLELAQSLILLSRSAQSPPQQYLAYTAAQAPSPQAHSYTNQSQTRHRETSSPSSVSLPHMSPVLPSPPQIATMTHNSHPTVYQTAPIHNIQLTPQTPFNPFLNMVNEVSPTTPKKELKTPLTPPSSKSKSRTELLKSPTKSSLQHNARVCISCGSDQSPCWRPSWSIKEGQLCNSCGLRYKKTSARCLNQECKKIPAKGEWSLMQSKGKMVFDDGKDGYSCLDCNWRVEVKK